MSGLKAIYKAGFRYKKSGVMLMSLQPKSAMQSTLFDDVGEAKRSANLMTMMDAINRKMGKGAIGIAASGTNQRWAMRRERKSPSYTTDWNELMQVDA